jgi:AraC-like DNA-binding protein/transcriptional regulator with XRE-family HTH domain
METFEHLSFPQRSRLYPLEPIGIDTPYVESLTSYIIRLAHAYRVQPRTLVLQEILPLLKISNELKQENRLPWLRGSTNINGMTQLVNDWVQALEQLTCHHNLRFLTMLTWSCVIDFQRVVRSARAWCPACYHEWLQAGKIIYDPLIWNLRVITECPWHHRELHTRCPCCKKTLPLLIDWAKPGHCPKCESWLGALDETGIVQAAANEDRREWNQWVANEVGVLLAAAPHLSAPPEREKIKSGITAFLGWSGNGKIATLSRQLGVSGSNLTRWQRGSHLPGFEIFLRVCKQMDVSPLHFLVEDADTLLIHRTQNSPLLIFKKQSNRMSIEEVRQALEDALKSTAYPFPSLKKVAGQLHYHAPVLQHLFPELCDAISQRYQQQLDPDDQRKALDAVLVDSELRSLSLSEVARRLGCPVTLLKYRFPNQCREIAKRSRKTLNLAHIRFALDTILASSEEPPPSIKEVQSHLGCSSSTLYLRFPEACHAITKRYQEWLSSQRVKKDKAAATENASILSTEYITVKERLTVGEPEGSPRALKKGPIGSTPPVSNVKPASALPRRKLVDINQLRLALEMVLITEEEPSPPLTVVAKRLEWSCSTLYCYFPELCHAITRRHAKKNVDGEQRLENVKDTTTAGRQRKVADIDGLRRALEVVLMGEESPPPTMVEVARRLGFSSSVLYHYFPQQCRAIAEQHKKGTRNIDSLRQALEEALMNDKSPFPTVQEVVKNLGCSDSTLYHYFPDYCHAIAKRHQLDRDHMRQLLEGILASEDCPPSDGEIARRLGCDISTLRQYFPQECKEIKERHWKIADASRQRQALEAALADDGQISWSINEIARQLGCSSSTLYSRFPELCHEITKRRWSVSDIDHLRQLLEAALVENPPPTLEDVAKRLECSTKNIQYNFPELFRAITERRRALHDRSSQQKELEEILARGENPLSLQEVARRLGISSGSLRKRYPELCATISARYTAFRKNGHEERIKRICDEVRLATLSVHFRGDYPSKSYVGALLHSPACFRKPEVREAWRETMHELGYEV